MKIRRFNENLELDELYRTLRNLEDRADNYFGDDIEHTGDRGYQDLLQDIDEVQEEIDRLEKGDETNENNTQHLINELSNDYGLDTRIKTRFINKMKYIKLFEEIQDTYLKDDSIFLIVTKDEKYVVDVSDLKGEFTPFNQSKMSRIELNKIKDFENRNLEYDSNRIQNIYRNSGSTPAEKIINRFFELAKNMKIYINNYPFGIEESDYTLNDLKVIEFKKGYMQVDNSKIMDKLK